MGRSFLLVRLLQGLLLLVAGPAATLERADGAVVAGESNLERLTTAAADAADSVLSAVDGSDTVCVAVAEHPASWLLERAFVERAATLGRSVRRCGDDEPGRVQTAITDLGVVYRTTDETHRLQRTATVGLSALIPASTAGASGTSGLRSLRVERALIDTVNVADTATAGSGGYAFAVGTMADADGGSFWSKVLEPAVVLAAAAIAAILLFSVRSQ